MLGAFSYAGNRYRIGIDDQEKHCLPYKYYLIDQGDQAIPTEGYVAFLLDHRAEPFFKQGVKFIKQVKGQGGDRIQIKDGKVSINGQLAAELDPEVLEIVGKTTSEYDRDLILDKEAIWVMGTSKDSYDSRYWGPIMQAQVVGRVHPIY
jgi:conjugal transfer pilin signal peptidase TrbI